MLHRNGAIYAPYLDPWTAPWTPKGSIMGLKGKSMDQAKKNTISKVAGARGPIMGGGDNGIINVDEYICICLYDTMV